MKRTYTSTLMREDLTKATVVLEIHTECKYTATEADETTDVQYTGVKSWSIVEGGPEAEAIENLYNVEDDNHEYLILTFADGHTATFRNSYVDMWIY